MSVERRPAFYALARGGWRDYVTLLHLPYTLWHLSYVAIGAALVPELDAERLLWGLAAFALALGVGAHALDELHGRPLHTAIPRLVLIWLAISSLVVAVAIGIGAALAWTLWLLPFVAAGAFLVPAYALELLGGVFHTDLWFGLAWGAFPVLVATWARRRHCGPRPSSRRHSRWLTSLAQRSLSTQVRTVRRQVAQVSGAVVYLDGTRRHARRGRPDAGAGGRAACALGRDGRARRGARLAAARLSASRAEAAEDAPMSGPSPSLLSFNGCRTEGCACLCQALRP